MKDKEGGESLGRMKGRERVKSKGLDKEETKMAVEEEGRGARVNKFDESG